MLQTSLNKIFYHNEISSELYVYYNNYKHKIKVIKLIFKVLKPINKSLQFKLPILMIHEFVISFKGMYRTGRTGN